MTTRFWIGFACLLWLVQPLHELYRHVCQTSGHVSIIWEQENCCSAADMEAETSHETEHDESEPCESQTAESCCVITPIELPFSARQWEEKRVEISKVNEQKVLQKDFKAYFSLFFFSEKTPEPTRVWEKSLVVSEYLAFLRRRTV